VTGVRVIQPGQLIKGASHRESKNSKEKKTKELEERARVGGTNVVCLPQLNSRTSCWLGDPTKRK